MHVDEQEQESDDDGSDNQESDDDGSDNLCAGGGVCDDEEPDDDGSDNQESEGQVHLGGSNHSPRRGAALAPPPSLEDGAPS